MKKCNNFPGTLALKTISLPFIADVGGSTTLLVRSDEELKAGSGTRES